MSEEKNNDSVLLRFARLKSKIPAIVADSENPHFKSKYVSLPQILKVVLPILAQHEFCLSTAVSDKELIVEIYCACSATSEPIVSRAVWPFPDNWSCLAPQKRGTELTYAQRYTIAALLSLQLPGDDDDGNLASEGNETKPQNKPRLNRQDLNKLAEEIFATADDFDAFCWKVAGKGAGELDDNAVSGMAAYFQAHPDPTTWNEKWRTPFEEITDARELDKEMPK